MIDDDDKHRQKNFKYMFVGREKILILAAIAFVIIFALFALGRKRNPETGFVPAGSAEKTEGLNFADAVPFNAFLPNNPAYGYGQFKPENPNNSEENKGTTPQFEASFPSLNQVQNIVSSTLAPSLPAAEKPGSGRISPALPDVADGDLNIGADGLSSFADYLVYFAQNSDKINFDTKKLGSVLKDEYGIFLATPQLIEKELEDGPSADIRNSFAVQKEFLEAEISFLRQIRVSGAAVVLNKKMIGANLLTVSLIDSGIDLANGTMQKERLAKLYDDYVALILSEQGKLLNELQALSSGKKPGILRDLAESFKIVGIDLAHAAAINKPFGGFVLKPPVPCTSGGYTVVIGPPLPPVGGIPPGNLYVPPAAPVTPLLFPFTKIHPGTPMLGLYLPTLFVCSPISILLGDISAPILILGGAGGML